MHSQPGTLPVVLYAFGTDLGGMEEHVLQLGRGLHARGFPVAAICSPREVTRRQREALADAGVQVHCPAEWHPPGEAPSRLGIVRRLRALVGILRQYPGCILHIHVNGHAGGDIAQMAGHLAGVRAIIRTEHIPPPPDPSLRDRLRVRVRDRLLARVIYVSRQTCDEHLQRLGRDPAKSSVVANCVDLERFSPSVRPDGVHAELGLDPTAPLVGTVSRLGEERKGIKQYLEMAAQVSREVPTARFLIVGDGPLRSQLERQAQQLQIADRVVFAGERQDVPRLLAAMDIFVMPSLYEGGPYTILEAMAMAKPVVSTPVGLVPDVVEHGVTGLLAPIGDSNALARGVRQLLLDPPLRDDLARRGREVVSARFSADIMIDGVADVYREVAARSSRSRGAA